jgi:hypothetical protein
LNRYISRCATYLLFHSTCDLVYDLSSCPSDNYWNATQKSPKLSYLKTDESFSFSDNFGQFLDRKIDTASQSDVTNSKDCFHNSVNVIQQITAQKTQNKNGVFSDFFVDDSFLPLEFTEADKKDFETVTSPVYKKFQDQFHCSYNFLGYLYCEGYLKCQKIFCQLPDFFFYGLFAKKSLKPEKNDLYDIFSKFSFQIPFSEQISNTYTSVRSSFSQIFQKFPKFCLNSLYGKWEPKKFISGISDSIDVFSKKFF